MAEYATTGYQTVQSDTIRFSQSPLQLANAFFELLELRMLEESL